MKIGIVFSFDYSSQSHPILLKLFAEKQPPEPTDQIFQPDGSVSFFISDYKGKELLGSYQFGCAFTRLEDAVEACERKCDQVQKAKRVWENLFSDILPEGRVIKV